LLPRSLLRRGSFRHVTIVSKEIFFGTTLADIKIKSRGKPIQEKGGIGV
jgi:hypothetical protein